MKYINEMKCSLVQYDSKKRKSFNKIKLLSTFPLYNLKKKIMWKLKPFFTTNPFLRWPIYNNFDLADITKLPFLNTNRLVLSKLTKSFENASLQNPLENASLQNPFKNANLQNPLKMKRARGRKRDSPMGRGSYPGLDNNFSSY